MKRLIINFDPKETDVIGALRRTVKDLEHYLTELKRDGERVTATWDSVGTIFIYHDHTYTDLCIYEPGQSLPEQEADK